MPQTKRRYKRIDPGSSAHVKAVMQGVVPEHPGPHLHCENCGERMPTVLPMPIKQYITIQKSFGKAHRYCRPVGVR